MPTVGMRIALLADVHGNLPALEAVLADARDQGADTIWNAGDCVGYGAFPSECVARLRQACAFSILGNYDAKVLAFPRKQEKWSASKHPLKYRAFAFAWKNLDVPSRQWLASLPRRESVATAGRSILLVHGTDLDDDNPVGPHTAADHWRRCAEETVQSGPVDMILAGHIHRPFEIREKIHFVFAGSVGRPEDGDPRAHYTLVDLSAQEASIRNRRVAYDIDRAVAALEANRLPEAFSVMARRGVDLAGALAMMGEGSGN